MREEMMMNEELNLEALEDVNGGIAPVIIAWGVAGVASGAFFGYQTYKNVKKLRSNFCK